MVTYIETILKLPTDDKLEIMEKIWDSLDETIPCNDEEINIAREI